MLRPVITAIVALVCIASSASTLEALCPPAQTTFFYGNGIRRSPAEARADSKELAAFLNDRLRGPGQPPCDIRVRLAINDTSGAFGDLVQSAQSLYRVAPSVVVSILSGVAGVATGQPALTAYLLGRYRDISSQQANSYSLDIARQLAAYRAALGDPSDQSASSHVVIVAHSQGNLLANDSYRQLLIEYGPGLANRMRISSIATPDNVVVGNAYLASGPSRPNTTLQEDLIHLVPNALPATISSVPAYSCGIAVAFECHDFVRSYLNLAGPLSWSRIASSVEDAFLTDRIPKAGLTLSASGPLSNSVIEGETLRVTTLPGLLVQVNFDASRSSDPVGDLEVWAWELDGQAVAQRQFSRQLSAGLHTVRLTVKNNGEVSSVPATATIDICSVACLPTVPIARPDSGPQYTVQQGHQLAISAPGVLANDDYLPGDIVEFQQPLPAGLASLTSSDGSFVLDMATQPSFVGPLQISYAIRRPLVGSSSPTTVTIQVSPPVSTVRHWTQATPVTAPPARYAHMMTTDTARGQIVLFGGLGSGNVPLADTWIWNGSNWIARTPTISPPPRYDATIAFDAARGRAVLFGGYDAAELSDTWTWDGTTWRQEFPPVSPPARNGAAMAYDAVRQEVVLFGGQSNTGSSVVFDDTWVWNGSNWSQRFPANSPPASNHTPMAFDGARSEVVMFGTNGTFLRSDTWIWDGSSWSIRTPTAYPYRRSLDAVAYDPINAEIVMFGGNGGPFCGSGGGCGYLTDTWMWNGVNWTSSQSRSDPRRRHMPAMAHDPVGGGTVLFGGMLNGSVSNSDTWILPAAPNAAPPLPGTRLDWSIAANGSVTSMQVPPGLAQEQGFNWAFMLSGGDSYVDSWGQRTCSGGVGGSNQSSDFTTSTDFIAYNGGMNVFGNANAPGSPFGVGGIGTPGCTAAGNYYLEIAPYSSREVRYYYELYYDGAGGVTVIHP